MPTPDETDMAQPAPPAALLPSGLMGRRLGLETVSLHPSMMGKTLSQHSPCGSVMFGCGSLRLMFPAQNGV